MSELLSAHLSSVTASAVEASPLVVIAYKKSAVSNIALAEYSGLAFVTLFGIIWFDEVPDLLTALGILLIVVPMMPLPWKKWLS